jgi:hypothetical protein
MKLERQLQVLVEDGVDYGIAPVVIEKAIAPILKSLAQTLQHLEYYVWQNLQEDWIISVISPRQTQKLEEKKVIYAFATVQDAKSFSLGQKSDLMAIPIPVIQILFRVFSLQQIDSIIFFNQSGNITQGIEIQRRDLQNSIQQQILRLKTTPPNIA